MYANVKHQCTSKALHQYLPLSLMIHKLVEKARYLGIQLDQHLVWDLLMLLLFTLFEVDYYT